MLTKEYQNSSIVLLALLIKEANKLMH